MNSEIVYGRWPVREVLEAGSVSKVFLAQGVGGKPINEILKILRDKKIQFTWVDRRQLDHLTGEAHQGVVAFVATLSFVSFDDVLDLAKKNQGKGPSLLFLDGITDPQNLGAILRSAVFFGVPALVIPKWRAAGVTGAVVRASSGAARLIPISQVSNLATAMQVARKKGFWMVGASMEGSDLKTADIPRPFGLVLGSEGEGLHRLVESKCDLVVSIKGAPNRPGIGSLNVGVACGVLLYQLL